jgi:hypothetical protein
VWHVLNDREFWQDFILNFKTCTQEFRFKKEKKGNSCANPFLPIFGKILISPTLVCPVVL